MESWLLKGELSPPFLRREVEAAETTSPKLQEFASLRIRSTLVLFA